MVTLDIHFSSWNGIPFYLVVYGFYVYHFSVSKIFLKLQCPVYFQELKCISNVTICIQPFNYFSLTL